MSRVIDLTHPIATGMPVYPGTPSPVIEVAATVAEHGFFEHRLTLVTHTGTHVDAPAHMIADGRTLDTYPAETFVGPATVLDVAHVTGGAIDRASLESHAETIARQAFLLLHTGWSSRWGDATYFADFPALTPEAAAWLGEFGLRGIGLDAISIDRADATDFPVHHQVLGREMLIIENLAGLGPLVGREFTLCCLPLALAGADGAPVRAVALVG